MNKRYYYFLYKRWTFAVLFFLILTPSFRSPYFIAIRLEELAILFLLFVFAFLLLSNKKVVVYMGLQQKLFALSILIIPISILSGHLQGYDTSIGDFNQLIRWFKYIFISIVAFSFINLSDNPEKERIEVLEYISRLSIFLCGISLQQYFNLFGLNMYYVSYIAPTQAITLSGDYSTPRPVGLVGNPNELGFLFSIVTLICLYLLLNHKKSIKITIIMILNIVLLTLTLSRSALVAVIIGVSIIIILSLFGKNCTFNVKPAIKLFVITITFTIVAMILFSYTDIKEKVLWRFSALTELSTDASWNARLVNWNENIELFKSSPLFGVGPLRRAQLEHAADNEWLLFLRSYGIFGTLLMICAFLLSSYKIRKDDRVLYISILIAMSVYMIPASVFHSLTLMPIIIIVFAICSKTVVKGSDYV